KQTATTQRWKAALRRSGRDVDLRTKIEFSRREGEGTAALEAVDFVTWFGGSDPRPLIRKLRADVLVKGGDWKPSSILGSEDVWGWGGIVKSIPVVKGYSTTKLLQGPPRSFSGGTASKE
ncbi:MAG: hypothetical protein AAB425_00335, partial [Bdellovibrionota bacterium]